MAVTTPMQYICAPGSRLFLALCLISTVSATCAPSPIPIRIGNVTSSTSGTTRGLNVSVGSPQQPFAFLPQWSLNNSFLYGANGFCDSGWSQAACTTFRGGQYNDIASTTRAAASSNLYPVDASPYPQYRYITDNLILNSNVTLKSFPLGIALADWSEQSYHPQFAIGLGSNSTLLNALKSSGQIISRSWGIFWGRTGATPNTQLDGNFIFGGYDRAKVTGDNYTRNLNLTDANCSTSMLVSIIDMTLNFANGTDASLFEGAAPISACIVPDYPVLMTIPQDPYFDNFVSLTNGNPAGRSFGLYYYGVVYNNITRTKPYTGDLTIKLDSGFSVRIPNDQLVVPNVNIDTTTGQQVANSSAPELVINPILGGQPQIGRQFLSSAYLMVNQDTEQFTLWTANPTNNEDLVAVDNQNQIVEETCTVTTPGSSTTTATSGEPQSTNSEHKTSSVSGGAIAGIVIGSLVALGALAAIILFLVSRSKRRGEAEGSGLIIPRFSFMSKKHDANTVSAYTESSHDTYTKSELAGQPVLRSSPARELPAPELPPQELAS